MHTLFLDVGIAVLFLIFVHARTATPYTDNVIGIRRQFVVVRRGLLPFRVTRREVDILTLCDAGLTAHAQSGVIQHTQRTRIGGRFSAAAWLTDGAAPNSNAPPEAALIKSRLFTVILPVSQRYLSLLTPQFTYRHHADAGNQTDYAAKQTDSARRDIAAFFHIDVRFL